MTAPFELARARRALVWLTAFKVLVLVLFFDAAGNVPFDQPKSLASRAIEWVMAGLILWVLLVYGRAAVPRTRLHAAVAGVALVTVVAAVFAAVPYVAAFGEQDRYLGLTFLIDMVVLYLAVAIAVRDDRDVGILLGAIAMAGVIAGGYAVIQTLGMDPFAWAADARGRPFATFGNPDQFGHFISVLFGVLFGAAVGATDHGRRAIAGAGALATLGLAAIVATRGTLVGVVAAVAGVIAVRRPTARATIVGAAATVAVAGALLVTPLGRRAVTTVQGGVLPDRIQLYEIAARGTLARPLLGYGPDNFRAAFVGNRTADSLAILGVGPQTSAHDWVLDSSATTGLLGLAALVVLVCLGTIGLAQLARARPAIGMALLAGWAAYWANGLVDVGSVAVGWFPWLALGVAAALRGRRGDAAARSVPRWLGAAITVVVGVGVITGARAFVANEEVWASSQASHFGDPETAVILADRAAARDGGRADHWNRLGLALESQRRWSEAAAAYRAAATRQPYEPVYWANLARSLARVALGGAGGSQDDAIAAARQAIAVDPNTPFGHLTLAEIATSFGRCDLARSEAAQAASLQPGLADAAARAAACR
jgi:O-antigen ligase